jgi:hypothetical protein
MVVDDAVTLSGRDRVSRCEMAAFIYDFEAHRNMQALKGNRGVHVKQLSKTCLLMQDAASDSRKSRRKPIGQNAVVAPRIMPDIWTRICRCRKTGCVVSKDKRND